MLTCHRRDDIYAGMEWFYAIAATLAALASLLNAFEATMARLAEFARALLWLWNKLAAIMPLPPFKESFVLCPVGTTALPKKL
jgi:hypothetical protein